MKNVQLSYNNPIHSINTNTLTITPTQKNGMKTDHVSSKFKAYKHQRKTTKRPHIPHLPLPSRLMDTGIHKEPVVEYEFNTTTADKFQTVYHNHPYFVNPFFYDRPSSMMNNKNVRDESMKHNYPNFHQAVDTPLSPPSISEHSVHNLSASILADISYPPVTIAYSPEDAVYTPVSASQQQSMYANTNYVSNDHPSPIQQSILDVKEHSLLGRRLMMKPEVIPFQQQQFNNYLHSNSSIGDIVPVSLKHEIPLSTTDHTEFILPATPEEQLDEVSPPIQTIREQSTVVEPIQTDLCQQETSITKPIQQHPFRQEIAPLLTQFQQEITPATSESSRYPEEIPTATRSEVINISPCQQEITTAINGSCQQEITTATDKPAQFQQEISAAISESDQCGITTAPIQPSEPVYPIQYRQEIITPPNQSVDPLQCRINTSSEYQQETPIDDLLHPILQYGHEMETTHKISPTRERNLPETPCSQPQENNKPEKCSPQLTKSENDDRPTGIYRDFMDSSLQKKTFMVDKLVGTFANVIDAIWYPNFLNEQQKVKVVPTKAFINEILKRSKATYSTVQISLFYIFRVKKVVHDKLYQRMSTEKQTGTQMDDLMCCGRRMFLASLMVASKYLHDKNYHNKTWCKITGLDIKQINASEMAFLKLIDYRLHVSKPTFDKWYTQLHGHLQKANTSESPISKPCPNNILPSPPYSDPKPIHSVSEREKKNAEDTNKQWLLMSPPYTQSEGLPSKKRESSILRVDHVHMEVKRLRQ